MLRLCRFSSLSHPLDQVTPSPISACLLAVYEYTQRGMVSMLAPITTWWIILHLLLVPLFALMGWAIFLLIENIHSFAATLSRYATIVYISFAIAFDSAVGLTSGILVDNAAARPASEQGVIQHALLEIFSNPAIIMSNFMVTLSGTIAICAAAWSLAHVGVPRLPLIILLGTVLSTYSHALPFGPLGSACFFLAALWIELVWSKQLQKEGEANSQGKYHFTLPEGVVQGQHHPPRDPSVK